MGIKLFSAFPIVTAMNNPGVASQFAKPCTDNAIPAIDQYEKNADGTEHYTATRNIEDYGNAACKCVYPEQALSLDADLCNTYFATKDPTTGALTPTGPDYAACVQCAHNYGMWTGLGCINTGPTINFFVNSILAWGLGIGGGFATLCIMYSAFILQTSRGNPEKIKRSRDYLNSCLIGLGVILFAVLILQIIGVDLLKIPGFSR